MPGFNFYNQEDFLPLLAEVESKYIGNSKSAPEIAYLFIEAKECDLIHSFGDPTRSDSLHHFSRIKTQCCLFKIDPNVDNLEEKIVQCFSHYFEVLFQECERHYVDSSARMVISSGNKIYIILEIRYRLGG